MAVEKIMPATQKVVGAVKESVKAKEPYKTINSYEFHLGFIPQHNPHGVSPDDPVKVQHFIDMIV